MTPPPLLLAIDQGTTSSRVIAFAADGSIVAQAGRALAQCYPREGWVEHDPEAIWRGVLDSLRDVAQALGEREQTGRVAAVGITNQRETAVIWDRRSGRPIANAIVWQDRRTADACEDLKARGAEPLIAERTGLRLDPYFSATKIAWLLDHHDGARAAAERGDLAFGTIDAFLLWRLTAGAAHASDATNASRTALYDIHRNQWDDELAALFGAPRALLPDVKDTSDAFGEIAPGLPFAGAPIGALVGDQQAALVGQACFRAGDAKSTYGTGCFAVANTGERALSSSHGLLTTIGYRLRGETTYALEGSIFVAGAAVQWLRDELGVVEEASQTEALARSIPDNGGVYLAPAFAGLGAPHWDARARGAVFGLTRGAGRAHLARAALESVAYQTRDLLDAFAADGAAVSVLRVDGGMTVSDWTMDFLADICAVAVERPAVTETTALGAAALAGLQCGVFGSLDEAAAMRRPDRRFTPQMDAARRERLMEGWARAIKGARAFAAR